MTPRIPKAMDRIGQRPADQRHYEERRTRGRCATVGVGSDYTPDEVEFLQAVDLYKRTKRNQFPALTELLAVAVGLGYRKQSEATDGTEEAV